MRFRWASQNGYRKSCPKRRICPLFVWRMGAGEPGECAEPLEYTKLCWSFRAIAKDANAFVMSGMACRC